MAIAIFDYHTIKPFESIGLTGPFWTMHIDILCATWLAMALLFCTAILGRYFVMQPLNPIGVACEKIIHFFADLCKDSFKPFNYYYFAFITSLFLFSFSCCLVGLIPFVEEATRDLNTTLALGVTSFLYVNYQKIKTHGFLGFCKEFIEPIFVLAPIHIVGEIAKIASMSFRLFGNILGSGVIIAMMIGLVQSYKIPFLLYTCAVFIITMTIEKTGLVEKFPTLKKWISISRGLVFALPMIQLVLGVFEGIIQSFVIMMLTTTYLAIGTQHDEMEHTPENKPPPNTPPLDLHALTETQSIEKNGAA
jgi:F-type H+-transporting ATPase subunit a